MDDIVKARKNMHAIEEKKKKNKNQSPSKAKKVKNFFLKYFVFEGNDL
ncbi:MAG: hypothetical protein J6B73_10330 [Methanobrevibacter sp.]|nr:hypothetical protein [Methanobrevibacter sp.]MBO5152540.1 hypothetical protein [Methanobrevibacter sp.]